MTVCLLHRMQEPLDFRAKQRPKKVAALGSDISMSCVPANRQAQATSRGEVHSTDTDTARNNIQEESTDSTDDAEDPKQKSAVDGTGSQVSATKDSLCTADLSTIPSGVRSPPPSLVSSGEDFSCVAVDNICIHINVPAPSETDVIARVSREALSQEDDSDEYASGEEWDDERKSEYSTADEDFEPLHQRDEKMITFSKQPDIEEGEDGSVDVDVTDSARTDANRRDPCAPTFAAFGANSEALRPVVVRQVSQEEDVRVTSDDDETDRLGRPLIDEDDRSILPRYIYCERIEVPDSLHDSATSPIPETTRRCDEATEPVRWSEEQSTRKEPVDSSSPRDEPDFTSDRRRSLPTLHAAYSVPLSSQEIEYPTLRRSGRYSEPITSPSHPPELKGRRATQAMVEALAVCEQELGPLAVCLAELQDKVRKLNLPDMSTPRPPSTLACGPSTNILPLNTRRARMSAPIASASPCPQRVGGSWSEPASRLSHDVDCLCRYCGLHGADSALSPVARMYILMAQPRRTSCEHNQGNGQHTQRS